MRGVRTVVLALLASAVLLLPSPVRADLTTFFVFERPVGTAPSGSPAQTLLSATADVNQGVVDRVSVTVELGAEPTPETDARAFVGFGTLEDGSCSVYWSEGFSTFDPHDVAVRDGSRISMEATVLEHDHFPDSVTCAVVQVRTPYPQPPQLLDQLDGHVSGTVVGEPGGRARIVEVTHRRLPVGRWSHVDVEVANRGSDLWRLRVTGSGRGLRVREAVVEGPILTGERLVVRVPVLLRRDRAASLELVAHPMAGFDEQDVEVVRVRPRR
jgi:hypothetical protein